MLSGLNAVSRLEDINIGDVLIIKRKIDKKEKYLIKVKDIVNGNEVLFSNSNDYFNFDMYYIGESWVWRVWNIGKVSITSITNTLDEFPRR